jgi:hypothetical protein
MPETAGDYSTRATELGHFSGFREGGMFPKTVLPTAIYQLSAENEKPTAEPRTA